ncbi:MAG: hypothetical protein CMH48_15190 [Muricauda sp.]|jgi:hypothetical protein|nr:DUF5712 family protein [Allomuricauda sp.]MAU17059.1 hypothetical protein [Allomuricauda sp.]MBC32171.1 hypothetical protein [Allomuricauda sp.]|tara:strand:+ start:6055 stop:6906 length:852 start_codon:yes stop_codon:yes gene_type:complete
MPVSIVHKTTNDNKGSCSKYGFYLNKENKECIKEGRLQDLQPFFNLRNKRLTTMEAIALIDENGKGKGLRSNQDRYFTLTLNFSQKELAHLAKKVAKRNIENVKELNGQEFEKFNELLSDYTKQAMKNYANNFNKGITENQIAWFAKIEHRRHYKGNDEEVVKGKAISGQLKDGLQSHVHVTVSRMHRNWRINLSPLTNARTGKNLVLNGRKVLGGFDRSNWKQLNENSFDTLFDYKRGLDEKYETHRTLKLGSLDEKRRLQNQLEEERKRSLAQEKKNQKSL